MAFESLRNIFGPKPDASTDNDYGTRPFKRLFSGVGPEPKDPWTQMFQVPQYKASPEPQSDPMGDGDFMARIREMQAPGPAMTAYQHALKEQPTYEDNRPSGWRIAAATIGGAAGGFHNPESGAKIAENINMQPYTRARQEWTDKVAGLGEGAKLEADQGTRVSNAYNQMMTRRQADIKEQHDTEKDRRTLALAEWKALNPNLEIKETSQGFVAFHPVTGEAKVLGGTPVSLMRANTAQDAVDVSRYGANTTRRLGEANLGVRRNELDETVKRDADVSERGWTSLGRPDPEREGKANQLALEQLRSEGYSSFIDDVGKTGAPHWVVKDDVNPVDPRVQQFKNRWKTLVNEKSSLNPLPSNSLQPAPQRIDKGFTLE